MKHHPTYTHISVSRDGLQVYSTLSGKYLSQYMNDNGYMIVNVTTGTNKRRGYRVHRLVAETYLPNEENLTDVNHIDHDKTNNNVDNLEWCDRAYNIRYAIQQGFNLSIGETHSQATYTEAQIIEVCDLIKDGLRNCDIEKLTSVNKDTISKLRHKEAWSHLDAVKNLPAIHRKGRISVDKVKLVCQLLQDGGSNVHISDVTELSLFTVSKIRNRRIYSTISKDYSF